MSTLGDVVFCVDCDRARLASAAVATNGAAEPPRRMATKKDANGDPLCTSCLDARQAKRREEFMLHEGRAPIPGSQSAPAAPASPPVRKRVEFVRIVRSAPRQQAEVPAAPREKRAAVPKVEIERVIKTPVAPSTRKLERQFVMLAAEMGFLRAERLLGELAAAARRTTR